MITANQALSRIAEDGFAIVESIISNQQCEYLTQQLTECFDSTAAKARNRSGGIRNVLTTCEVVIDFIRNSELPPLVEQVFGRKAFIVRSILFDKTPDANWSVAWHQDLHIAVAEKIEAPGFGPWSVKAGGVHVQPPAEILSRMVTVRLHLDDCDDSNGALKVIPGSHAHGILSDAELNAWRGRAAVTCSMRRGGVLLMRPLLLHSSASATKPSHRRVLHLEYACEALPDGLRWNEQS